MLWVLFRDHLCKIWKRQGVNSGEYLTNWKWNTRVDSPEIQFKSFLEKKNNLSQWIEESIALCSVQLHKEAHIYSLYGPNSFAFLSLPGIVLPNKDLIYKLLS